MLLQKESNHCVNTGALVQECMICFIHWDGVSVFVFCFYLLLFIFLALHSSSFIPYGLGLTSF